MTDRKASAKAKEEADPCGMTARKATATASAKYRGLSTKPREKLRGFGRDDDVWVVTEKWAFAASSR
jgi:hypothetical protein